MNSEEKHKVLRKCVQKNDCDAFFSEYGKLIANVVRKVLQRKTGQADPETIEDICHDVFVAFLEKDRKRLRDYDSDKGSLRNWIILITNRMTLNRIWKKEPLGVANRNCLHFLDEFPENYQLKAGSQAENQTRIREILDAVNTFPQQERLVFKLHFLNGLSDDKIARRLGKKKSAIQTCKSRARKRLKKSFGPDNEDT
ncbi:hypothetical protein DENIS_0284 [Desulfonema ishimotonii]|uniref:Sigma-70 family RNA polymerase sigma factor n=1 Tax=Desulfonema ishimotonii TaxID=45657 RepID=A0A401FQV2_9BACT|nr:sigma-70 family RNA polymerase sigma factor [Desulfonema ishimotonii]GBC59345.1 hypothetical protein DENIS_0284 [Desulfonema ishimotonii]